MNTKGFASVLVGALFECGWAYGLKRAASTHDRRRDAGHIRPPRENFCAQSTCYFS